MTHPFPPHETADEDGFLCHGGELSTELLLHAYKNGIFPWYDRPPILWFSPDPRFVLFPDELKVSKSMKVLLNRNEFEFKINSSFKEVMKGCAQIKRPGQRGTWINKDMIQAYTELHHQGFAHSAEAWKNGELVGGLYGIKLGAVFFGESMFSKESNASKFAFISYVHQLKEEGIQLIDCQTHTDHLESLGAQMIPRKNFLQLLQQLL